MGGGLRPTHRVEQIRDGWGTRAVLSMRRNAGILPFRRTRGQNDQGYADGGHDNGRYAESAVMISRIRDHCVGRPEKIR